MLPNSWAEEVYVVSLSCPSLDTGCSMFEEWEHVRGDKTSSHFYFHYVVKQHDVTCLCLYFSLYFVEEIILQKGSVELGMLVNGPCYWKGWETLICVAVVNSSNNWKISLLVRFEYRQIKEFSHLVDFEPLLKYAQLLKFHRLVFM